jgi:hypothetical protein
LPEEKKYATMRTRPTFSAKSTKRNRFSTPSSVRAIRRELLFSPPTAAATPSASRKQDEKFETLREPLRVFLRIRPLPMIKWTQEATDISCIRILHNHAVAIEAPADSQVRKLGERNVEMRCLFSKVFDGSCNQEDLFLETTLPLVTDFLHGQDGLCFTYGVTNAGKTYTIQGTKSKEGLLPRSLQLIFQSLDMRSATEEERAIFTALCRSHVPADAAEKAASSSAVEDGGRQPENNTENDNKEDEEETEKPSSSAFKGDSDSPDFGQEMIPEDSCLLPELSNDIRQHSEDTEMPSVSSSEGHAALAAAVTADAPTRVHVEPLLGEGEENSMVVSYFEIYNEYVYDLLAPLPHNKRRPPLKVRSDKSGRSFIQGVKEIPIFSVKEAQSILEIGQKNRHVAETLLHEASSRSHSIFVVKLIRRKDGVEKMHRLSIVDLAGSERTSRTQNMGARVKETGNINSSLMNLGRCMEAPRWNQQHPLEKPRLVPFRDSKLTHLFHDALSGGKATMIVNVNPAACDYDDTYHVLKFAAVAREVKTIPLEKISHHPSKTATASASTVKDHWRRRPLPQELEQSPPEMPEEDNTDLEDMLEYQDLLHAQIDELKAQLLAAEREKANMESDIRAEVSEEMAAQLQEMQAMFQQQQVTVQSLAEEALEKKMVMVHQETARREAAKSRFLLQLNSSLDSTLENLNNLSQVTIDNIEAFSDSSPGGTPRVGAHPVATSMQLPETEAEKEDGKVDLDVEEEAMENLGEQLRSGVERGESLEAMKAVALRFGSDRRQAGEALRVIVEQYWQLWLHCHAMESNMHQWQEGRERELEKLMEGEQRQMEEEIQRRSELLREEFAGHLRVEKDAMAHAALQRDQQHQQENRALQLQIADLHQEHQRMLGEMTTLQDQVEELRKENVMLASQEPLTPRNALVRAPSAHNLKMSGTEEQRVIAEAGGKMKEKEKEKEKIYHVNEEKHKGGVVIFNKAVETKVSSVPKSKYLLKTNKQHEPMYSQFELVSPAAKPQRVGPACSVYRGDIHRSISGQGVSVQFTTLEVVDSKPVGVSSVTSSSSSTSAAAVEHANGQGMAAPVPTDGADYIPFDEDAMNASLASEDIPILMLKSPKSKQDKQREKEKERAKDAKKKASTKSSKPKVSRSKQRQEAEPILRDYQQDMDSIPEEMSLLPNQMYASHSYKSPVKAVVEREKEPRDSVSPATAAATAALHAVVVKRRKKSSAFESQAARRKSVRLRKKMEAHLSPQLSPKPKAIGIKGAKQFAVIMKPPLEEAVEATATLPDRDSTPGMGCGEAEGQLKNKSEAELMVETKALLSDTFDFLGGTNVESHNPSEQSFTQPDPLSSHNTTQRSHVSTAAIPELNETVSSVLDALASPKRTPGRFKAVLEASMRLNRTLQVDETRQESTVSAASAQMYAQQRVEKEQAAISLLDSIPALRAVDPTVTASPHPKRETGADSTLTQARRMVQTLRAKPSPALVMTPRRLNQEAPAIIGSPHQHHHQAEREGSSLLSPTVNVSVSAANENVENSPKATHGSPPSSSSKRLFKATQDVFAEAAADNGRNGPVAVKAVDPKNVAPTPVARRTRSGRGKPVYMREALKLLP